MIEIVPFKKEHGNDPQIIAMLFGRGYRPSPETFEAVEKSGMAFSGFEDGKLIGCAGIALLHSGVGEAWAALTEAAKAKPMMLHREVKRRFQILMEQYRLHRVQSLVRLGFVEGDTWMEKLGFFKEGVRLWYGHDQTSFSCYVFLREPENV